MPIVDRLTAGQSARIEYLRSLKPGWHGHGVGAVVGSRCFSATQALLAALPTVEQDAWRLSADLDGGIAAERESFVGAPDVLVFCDISPQGQFRLVWFADAPMEHHVYDTAAATAEALLAVVARFEPTRLTA